MSHKRIHITSSGPRTGTTLLTEVFRVCFHVDHACDHEASIAQSNYCFGKSGIVLTKHPSKTFGMRRLLELDKELFIICLIRDPRDMVSSFHGADKDRYYCQLNFWISFLADYTELVNHERFIPVSYEEFTTKPDKIQLELMKKMGFLRKKTLFSQYHHFSSPNKASLLALKKLRPIESSGIGNWKNHLSRIKQQLEKFGDIDESLIYFNYESDGSWKKIFQGIQEVSFESYKKDFYPNPTKAIKIAKLNIWIENLGINPNIILRPLLKIRSIIVKKFLK